MRIFVTGGSGLLGGDLTNELRSRGHTVSAPCRAEADITDFDALRDAVTAFQPDAVMHLAAYTAVDKAEDERETCLRVNADGTENVARLCGERGIRMMYISSDYVFSGRGDTPWQPDDIPSPLSVYGKSKLLGEEAVRKNVPRHFIVRTLWLFGKHGKNFADTMLRLGAEKEQITVVCDQIGAPTYTADLAKLLADMIVTDRYGTYHAANEGECSWYAFACAIMKNAGLSAAVMPVTSREYGAKAVRPPNSCLDTARLTENGFERLPRWEDALERYLRETGQMNEE